MTILTEPLQLIERPRRHRKTMGVRDLCQETHLLPSDFIQSYFVIAGEDSSQPISSFPGVHRMSIDRVIAHAETLHRKGVMGISLFPAISPDKKDPFGTAALDPDGIIPKAIIAIKRELPELCLITDIALDPFTTHSHDGILDEKGNIDNDGSLEILSKMALLHAQCGVDFVAPSATLDGRIKAIRRTLDIHRFTYTGIISYTAKYASNLYGPFRNAVSSGLKKGDKKTYQLNPANRREAMREAMLEETQGADILMVKPASIYLDVISEMRRASNLPIAAYHVSGEYAMAMAADQLGYLDGKKLLYETFLSIKRAGADMIFNYATPLLIDELDALRG